MNRIDARFYEDNGEFAILAATLGSDTAAAEMFAAEVGLSAVMHIDGATKEIELQQVQGEEI